MTTSQDAAPVGDRYWVIPVARGVVAAIAAVIVTFNADHSAQLGLVVFGGFGIVTGLLVAVVSWRTMVDGVGRAFFLGQGLIGVASGIVALVANDAGNSFFVYLVSVWAALSGFLELYSGFRSRRTSPAARDWLVIGVITAVLALVFLLLPINTNAVVAVGLLGAYTAIVAVYLLIAGLSLKWSPASPAADSSTQPAPSEAGHGTITRPASPDQNTETAS
ncbi:HdeD family acid-resistance protein [Compostimonas suwonensis]|uniref:Uncharacterized membrane protein HdeD (DUF308 family) n=1 Tax=Compostimonas suwonensis TaxID=1048394 RepID=A0A2M9C4A2_9MICO|nr:DUF308 domain-containing protein [Compostimonas suwonensis]PJJ65319.1 uncharacterized membrane protein HdeD (DUF308 family) [Compostimonas suwonensis]